MKHIFFLTCLVFTLIGFGLRIISISDVPSELHRDELSIGYTAYALLKTQRDELGVGPFPMVFESFGDYKLPGLIYTTVLSIAAFGVTPLAVRLPTVVFGTLLIPIAFLFVDELFKNKKIAIVTSFLVTFSMWHTFLSRTAYEPISGLTFLVLALTLLLKARKQFYFFILAAVAFLISFLFYNLPLLLAPLLIFGMVLIFRNEYLQKGIGKTIVGIVLLLVPIVGVYAAISALTGGKLDATIIATSKYQDGFNDYYYQLVHTPLTIHQLRVYLANASFAFFTDFAKGYFAAFEIDYLFISGGSNGWHSLGRLGLGNLSFLVLPFWLYGMYCLIRMSVAKNKTAMFLLWYFFIAPLPDALTFDAPVTNRLLDFHFAMLVITAVGIVRLYSNERVPQFQKRLLFLATGITGLFLYGIFIGRYFLLHQYNLHPIWIPGFRQVSQYLHENEAQYEVIYIDTESAESGQAQIESAYVYQAFYAPIEPKQFHETVVWEDRVGLKSARQVGKFRYYMPTDEVMTETALIVSRNKHLREKYSVINEITDLSNKNNWYFLKKVTLKE